MLIITNLEGRSLPLPKVDKFERKKGTNGDYEVALRVRKTERNSDAFDLIETESIITFGKENYRIKIIEKDIENNQPIIEATALHVLYDMSGYYQYDVIKGEKVLSLHQALTHALEPTDYTFIIQDDFDNISLENFGDDNSIALFNELKQKFDFEFSIENKHFTIVEKLGSNSSKQMRWKHNIKAIKVEDNTSNLATHIKGYGKPREDSEGNAIEGEYEVTAEYTSPHADKYDRIITATPYYNEKITHKATLLDYLRDRLIDEPEFTYQIEYDELAKNIITQLENVGLGDAIHVIHEPLDIKIQVRVVEVVDYPLHPQIKPVYTISSKSLDLVSNDAMQIADRAQKDKEITSKQNEHTRGIEKAIEAVHDVEHIVENQVIPEMERIENEVIPAVEQAVEDTKIPTSVEPPYPIPTPKLWWDSSKNPPRLMRYDGDEWVVLAPNKSEIDDLMEQMKQEAISQGITYTDAEVQAARQAIINRLEQETGDISNNITSLQDTASNLIDRANSADERLDDTEESLSLKLDSLDYTRDKTGILSSIERNESGISTLSDEIDLRVTKEQYKADSEEFDERITDTEAGIKVNAESIEAKAEKSELTNYVDKQTYTNQVGELTVSIEDITGRVEKTETDIDDVTGEYTSFRQDYAEFVTEMDNFTTRVGHLSDDGKTLSEQLSEVIQESGSIVSRVSDVEIAVDDKASREEAIKTVVVEYYLSTSSTTTTGGSWNVTPPNWVNGRYFWSRTKTTYSDGRVSTTDPVNITGAKGDTGATGAKGVDGATGRSVVSITTQYYNSTSKTTQSGGSWVNTQPTWVKGRYLWTRTRIIYKDPSGTEYTTPVIDNSWESMTKVETTIEQLPESISLKVSEGISDLEIGGRNLIPNTDFTDSKNVSGLQSWTSGTTIALSSPTDFDGEFIRVQNTSPSIDEVIGFSNPDSAFFISRGETYTLSFLYIVSGYAGGSWYNYIMRKSGSNQSLGNASVKTRKVGEAFGSYDVKKATITFTASFTDEAYLLLGRRATVEGLQTWVRFGEIMLEKGNKATDWQLAEEDRVNKTNVLSSINLSTEGVKITGQRIDIAGLVTVLNTDGSAGTMIQGGKIVGQSITANQLNVNNIFGNSAVIAKIQADSVKTASLDAGKITTGTLDAGKISVKNLSASSIIAGTLDADKVRIRNINASEINGGTINAIDIVGSVISGGRLQALNNNTNFNLNTGQLTIGNGADIEFEHYGNRLYYNIKDPQGTLTRSAGVGVGRSINNRFPFAFLGTSTGTRPHPRDDDCFVGFIANTNARITADSIGNSSVGDVFQVRDNAVSYTKGFEFDLRGSNNFRMRPVSAGSYDYWLGARDNQFAGLYARQMRTSHGYFIFRNSSSDYSSQGFRMDTTYDGDDQLYFRGINSSEYYSLGRSGGWRFRHVYLRYQPDVSSDERLKTGIKDLDKASEIIDALEPIEYRYKLSNKDLELKNSGNMERGLNTKQFGFSAQHTQQVLNDLGVTDQSLVNLGDDNYYGMQTTQIIPLLVKAFQDEKKRNDKLESRISKLEQLLA